MEALAYNLPDKKLLEVDSIPAALCWQPDEVYVVLGRSNSIEASVYADRITADGITLMKRPSGGETVVLTPLMLVIACTWPIQVSTSSSEVFNISNQIVMEVLAQMGISGIHQKGISDISLGDYKIAGSAMHRTRDRWFYHAVLNVAEPTGTIAWYIRHPKREPDYRRGRPHALFVTNLWEAGHRISITELSQTLIEAFRARGFDIL